jgi:hypothetical protein
MPLVESISLIPVTARSEINAEIYSTLLAASSSTARDAEASREGRTCQATFINSCNAKA